MSTTPALHRGGARIARALVTLAALLSIWTLALRAHADEEGKAADSLAADAEAARAAGLFDRCVERDTQSVQMEPRTTTRVHLAGCADRAGKIVLALEHMRFVLEDAIERQDVALADLTRQRVEQLLRRLGGITIDAPPDASELKVTLDETEVDGEMLGKKPIVVDPGVHRVHAEAQLDGTPATFDEVVNVADGERVTVAIVLRPRGAEHLTPGQLACMQAAKSDAEAFKCLPGQDKPLVARAAFEMNAYHDSFSVLVLNPLVRANIASPTSGWSVGASYLVDVISAASPDFVSTASPRGHDTRHAVAANGMYKPGRVGAEAAASYSTEADYVSRSGGLAVLADLFDKRVTPRLGWSVSYDSIGRGGTPFKVFEHELFVNEGVFSTSFVLSPKTVLVAGVTAGFERGDQSKPYRLIPMFARDVSVPAGASTTEVNASRLPVRPYEQLPKERDRWAVGARIMRRLGSSTLRLEERLYADTWQNRATTTDLRWLFDVSSRLTLGPHVRFHAQTGTEFFKRVYHADVDTQITLPTFRTTDRELGPMYAFTGGASAWWKVSKEDATVSWTMFLSGDALYSLYTNSLYVSSRLATYGTFGIEAVFE